MESLEGEINVKQFQFQRGAINRVQQEAERLTSAVFQFQRGAINRN